MLGIQAPVCSGPYIWEERADQGPIAGDLGKLF